MSSYGYQWVPTGSGMFSVLLALGSWESISTDSVLPVLELNKKIIYKPVRCTFPGNHSFFYPMA